MSSTTTESEDGILSKDQADSPSYDEGSCGGSLGGGAVLKKGPWTSAEDAILVDYVKKHGEGNWNAVQKHSGLSRCGKSCRLRWANHLRPNLKKGAFTSEEEHLIIELHAKMGNKWARMAAHLPGRTDNEIKNYWNTRIKRRQRAGLPLYPPDVRLQALHNSHHQGHNRSNEFPTHGSNNHPHDIMQSTTFEIPEIAFEGLKSRNQGIISYATPPQPQPPLVGDMSYNPPGNYNLLSAMHRPKRLRGGGPDFYYPSGFTQPVGLSSPSPSPFGVYPNPNGNFSASKHPNSFGCMKLELPSLQYSETDNNWGTPQSLIDSVDAYIQSPPSPPPPIRAGIGVGVGPGPQNSGLLDALLEESQSLTKNHNQSPEKSDIVDSPGMTEWGEEYGDPISPLGRSAASVFNEHTPLSGTSSGSEVKQEPVEVITTVDEAGRRGGFVPRPDALLDGSWFGQSGEEMSYSWNNLPPVYQMNELA